MKKFNKDNALRSIKFKQNKNTYIKKISIILSCVILLATILYFTFAKFETFQDFTLINGMIGDYPKYTCQYDLGTKWTYAYTGDSQKFDAPCNAKYRIELWGAQGGEGSGGSTSTNPATGYFGTYTSGTIELNENESLYLYVGGQGKSCSENATGGWNGGSTGVPNNCSYGGGGGGGATDVRYFESTPSSSNLAWNSNLGLNSRIMVASGGGGSRSGSAGGGVVGYIYGGSTSGNGTQTSGYAFGYSQDATVKYTANGGGGYYGGIKPTEEYYGYGASSYISGHTGCVAIAKNSTSNPRAVKKSGCTSQTTDNSCSIHYSNKIFENTEMIDGKACVWTNEKTENCGLMPQIDGSISNGRAGNGYVKITLVASNKQVNIELNTNGGTISQNKLTKLINKPIGQLEEPTKTGYDFDGWYTDLTFTNQVTSSTMVTSSLNRLYAKYIPHTYTVKFNANGGSGSMANEDFEYGTAKALTKNTFTRSGYTFMGWSTNSTSTFTNLITSLAGQKNVTTISSTKWYIDYTSSNIDTYLNFSTATGNEVVNGKYYTLLFSVEGLTSGSKVTFGFPGSSLNKKLLKNGYNKIYFLMNGGINFNRYVFDDYTRDTTQKFYVSDFILWENKGQDYFDEEKVTDVSAIDNDLVTLYAVWKKN